MRACVSRRWLWSVGLAVALTSAAVSWYAALPAATSPDPFTFHYESVLGTSMDLTVVADSEAAAADAESAVLIAIDRDAKVLSGYDPASEFSRWMQTSGTPVPVSAELAEVLGLFDTWRARTGGALDPAAERVSRLWKTAAAEGRVPSEAERRAAVADVQRRHWVLDAAARTATRVSQTPLILNSFTKSYIVDRAAAEGLAAGARGIVVNIGGDIAVRGAVTEQVAIRDPRASADNAPPMTSLSIGERAVATSGGYRRGFDINGHHYSHIVDPRTAQPMGHVLSATVVAEKAVDAGALATAMCVLAPEDSEQLAAGVPGAEFVLVLADGSRIESAGWRALEVKSAERVRLPSPVATLHAAEQTWDANYELTIALELARPGGMSRRPYLAVWIEDRDRFPVRTLALWFEKPRWLPDLRAWYRADRIRALAEGTNIVNTVSSATRAPGRYTLTWDGKDQQGKPVKPGIYTVNIEAAREHGTYQVMRQEMDLSGVAKKVDLPGNPEVAAVTLDYHRVAGR